MHGVMDESETSILQFQMIIIIKYVTTENDCLKYLIMVKKRKLLIYDNKLCYFNLLLLIIVYKR